MLVMRHRVQSVGKHLHQTLCVPVVKEVIFISSVKGSHLVLFLLRQDIVTFERIRKNKFKLAYLLDLQHCALPFKENQG